MVGSAITFCEYLSRYYLPTRPLAEGSAKQLAVAARLLDCPLVELTERRLAERLADYAKTHAAATTNSRRRALLTLWRAAADEGLASPPRTRLIPKQPEPRRAPVAWRAQEVSALLLSSQSAGGAPLDGVPRSTFWRALILTVYDTAGRIGAVLATEPADCNLGDAWIVLRAENQKDRTEQWCPLSDQTVDALRPMYDPRRTRLFPWPFSMVHLWRQFRRIVEAAGLSASRKRKDLFHKLRRTSLSYTARESVELACKKAGHCRPELTVRHYIDPRIANTGDAALDALAALPRP